MNDDSLNLGQASPQNSQDSARRAGGETTLRDILAPLFHHRKMVLLCFFGTFLVGAVVALLAPKYVAKMQILVKRERLDPVVTSEQLPQTVQATPPVTPEDINSEVQLLQTQDLLRQVVLSTGLDKSSDRSILRRLLPKENADERITNAVRQLSRDLDIEAVKDTNVIEVSYRSKDPRRAYHVLSTLGTLYLQKHLAVHRPPGAFDFFQQQTAQYETSLQRAEKRLAAFETKNGIDSAQLQSNLTETNMINFEQTLRETQTAISDTQERIDNLESQLKTTSPRMETAQQVSDNGQLLQTLGATLAELELKRNDMAAHYQADYRPLRDLDAQIAKARTQMTAASQVPIRGNTTDANPTYLWLTRELTSARANLATFQAKEVATQRNVVFYRQLASTLGQQQLEQADLMRTVNANEHSFLLYLDKREEARISDALDRRRILNVAIAEPPSVPVLPTHSRGRYLLFAFFLALIAGLGAGFISDYLDPTLRSLDETERVLEMPVLAAIPRTPRGRSRVA